MPAPKGANLAIVSQDMSLNGVKMRLWELTSHKLKPDNVLRFYKDQWSKKSKEKGIPPYVEYDVGEWKVVSHLQDGYQLTAQVQEWGEKGSIALLGITDIYKEESLKNFGENFPMKPNTLVINDILANDAGSSSRTLILRNKYNILQNYRFYKRELNKQGWQSTQEVEGDSSASTLLMVRNGAELNMTLERIDGKTSITAVISSLN